MTRLAIKCVDAWLRFGFGIVAAVLVLTPPSGHSASAQEALVGDPATGERLYRSRCFACHTLDRDRVGPRHRDVFGRQAGKVAGYRYSDALAAANFEWTTATLGQWLKDPEAFVPGQKMNFRVTKDQDRADIIAYLESVRP